jgi:hypothetical protein
MTMPNTELPNNWTILLQAWLIKDGNYEEFSIAQPTNFSLMFAPKNLLLTEKESVIACRATSENFKYTVVADVVALTSDFWVIDFGLWAANWSPPSGLQVGQRLQGEVFLSVDPFIISERASKLMDTSKHIYKWQIERIEKESAPWMDSTDETGRTIRVRDDSRLKIDPVLRTNAFDDEGFDSYILHCIRQDQ